MASFHHQSIEVIVAHYGKADVTRKAQELVSQGSLSFRASNENFGDNWPGVVKSFSIAYKVDNGPVQSVVVTEGELVTLVTLRNVHIISATYGKADVTHKAQEIVSQGNLSFHASNENFGDNWPGVVKSFSVDYRIGGGPVQAIAVTEGELVSLHNVHIISAVYGKAEVSEKVLEIVSQGNLSFHASNENFGDNWPGVVKSFSVVYRIGDGPVRTIVVTEGELVSLHDVHIISAVYGKADVSERVRKILQSQSSFHASNSTFGDTWPGIRKSFVIVYDIGGTVHVRVFEEDDLVKL
jgi:hypothetical protein